MSVEEIYVIEVCLLGVSFRFRYEDVMYNIMRFPFVFMDEIGNPKLGIPDIVEGLGFDVNV